MASRPIPTLSTNGWITETSAKLDYELGCLACTDALQSNTFFDVNSFPSIIQEHRGNVAATSDAIRDAVTSKLGRVFDEINVNASYQLVDPSESKTLAKITLSINFKENGKVYAASRILTFYNGKFKEIMEANNG